MPTIRILRLVRLLAIGGVAMTLPELVAETSRAQTAPIDNARAASLVAKITASHKQASDNAKALATYVQQHEANLDHAVMRAHCDALGGALDDAMLDAPKPEATLRQDASKRNVRQMLQHDTRAKEVYTRLIERLRGSSILAIEIKALALEVDQHVRAAQAELARVQVPTASAPVAGR